MQHFFPVARFLACFCFILFQSSSAIGVVYPPEEEMLSKLNECPSWMAKQISEDLSHFQNLRLSKRRLDGVFNEIPESCRVVKFTISNNNISITKKFEDDLNIVTRIGAYKDAINYLCSITKIPDLTFYLLIHDGFIHYTIPTLNETLNFPLFAMSRETILTKSKSILVPDYEALRSQYQVLQDKDVFTFVIPWKKKISQMIWRGCYGQNSLHGSSTSLSADNIHLFSRITLCKLSEQYPDLIDARFTTYCPHIERIRNLYGNWVSYDRLFEYKYHIMIHGNAATYGRSGWRFFSNSLVFIPKSRWTQWYYNELKPYVHYIPVQSNLEDLVGKIKWAMEKDGQAKKIAAQARAFALEKLKLSDHLVYLYFLLINYSQLNFVE